MFSSDAHVDVQLEKVDISSTQVTPTGCGFRSGPRSARTEHMIGFVRCRVDGDSLLHQAIKELPAVGGSTTVESEREFAQVVV